LKILQSIYSFLVQREKDEEELATLEQKIAERKEVLTTKRFHKPNKPFQMREQQNAERARKNQERREREQREKEAKAWAAEFLFFIKFKFVYLAK